VDAITVLLITTVFAAFVTGGLGYGFSSITVPIGLLFYSNRILNPALVLIEVGANAYAVFLARRAIPRIRPRVKTILIGLVPAIVLGGYFLHAVDVNTIKLLTYGALAPAILLQSYGFRRPIQTDGKPGYVFGGFVGLLYSMTTISGPPLALALNNEGYEKDDFRAAIALIRLVESSFTAVTYAAFGIFTLESLKLCAWMVPGVVVAMPLGALVLRRVDQTTFRRGCISFDSWLIAFGLYKTLVSTQMMGSGAALGWALAIVFVDALCVVKWRQARRAAAQHLAPVYEERKSA